MTLADELRAKPRIRSKRRVVRPLGAWEIFTPDPDIRREEIQRIHWTKSNRNRRAHGEA